MEKKKIDEKKMDSNIRLVLSKSVCLDGSNSKVDCEIQAKNNGQSINEIVITMIDPTSETVFIRAWYTEFTNSSDGSYLYRII